LLEVARATYAEAINDLMQLTKDLSELHEYPSMTAIYTAHGFVFTIDREEWDLRPANNAFNAVVSFSCWS